MTYTPTFTPPQLVAIEMALEAQLETLHKLRDELLRIPNDGFIDSATVSRSLASVDERIDTSTTALARCKRTPANSDALSHMLTTGDEN